MRVKITYPERKFVTPDWIAQQYADAVANGECEPGFEEVYEQAGALDDAGLITVSGTHHWDDEDTRPDTMYDEDRLARIAELEDQQAEPLDPHGPWGAP